MSRHEITDKQWRKINGYLPKAKRGRGRPEANLRKTLNGILYVLRTGCAWMDMPKKYGSYTTCWRRHRLYSKLRIWDRIWKWLLRDLYEEKKIQLGIAHVDASFVPAKRGGDKIGKTKLGKGSKVFSVVENKNGLPIALLIENANPHEITFAEKIVSEIRIPQKRGAPIRKPKILVADKGYISQAFRTYLRRKGILVRIPFKKNQKPPKGLQPKDFQSSYKQRFKVERSFAWMDNFRRLVVRYDRFSWITGGALTYAGYIVFKKFTSWAFLFPTSHLMFLAHFPNQLVPPIPTLTASISMLCGLAFILVCLVVGWIKVRKVDFAK